MPGLHLITSNRLENLVDRLANRMKEDTLPVFEPETIVVQSKGMQQWLNLQIAQRNRISAHIHFPFPKAFVNGVFEALGNDCVEDRYAPEVLTWKIMSVLPDFLEKPEFEQVRHYCGDVANALKLYQLSEKIGQLFDYYLIHRPDWINQWDNGKNALKSSIEGSQWQSELWQAITEQERSEGRLTHAAEWHRRLLASDGALDAFPRRISVFGLSTLPPFYLDVFRVLSRHISVFLYYLNPCREFWEYCYSEKETQRFLSAGLSEADQYYESGHPLLASMGVSGREFFSLMLTVLEDTGEQAFYDPPHDSTLHILQSDILNLTERSSADRLQIADEDRSIQIHSCHSPTREVEVLHDNLLALFDSDPELKPSDVVVMMPDVSVYAPLIRAVFDAQESHIPSIPYSITDVSLNSVSSVSETFLMLLDLSTRRFRASEVLDILENEAVRESVSVTEEELQRIAAWVRESGIRWGIDGDYKQSLGLPDLEQNTWVFGLKRMLLGVALPQGEEQALFKGISPFPGMEGDDALLLGRFIRFVEMLIDYSRQLNQARSLDQWSVLLNRILTGFFHKSSKTENQIQEIRETLLENGLLGLKTKAAFTGTVPLEVIISFLKRRLSGDLRSSGFISRGVTFCTLLPMRSIPFQVIYILGMNDGEFPRRFQRLGFDLTEHNKRLCDRSKREEDKYLFLESMLSARKYLFVSYIGQHVRDNTRCPPSVLVTELGETLEKSFKTALGDSVVKRITTQHPLQPFNSCYFADTSSLFSYSEQNFRAARANLKPVKSPHRFIDEALPSGESSDMATIGLEELCCFFRNPSAYLLKDRLSVAPRLQEKEVADDREPFELDPLELYQLKERYLAHRLQHEDDTAFKEILKANGELAYGAVGQITFDSLKTETDSILKSLNHLLSTGPLEAFSIQLLLDDPYPIVSGVLKHLVQKGQLFYRPARLKAKDWITAWIHHLALCIAKPSGVRLDTFCLGTEKILHFHPVEDEIATSAMMDLLSWFETGSRFPLPFFPECSLALVQAINKGKPLNPDAVNAARRKWVSTRYQRGESADEAVRLCFGDAFPWSDRFQDIAQSVFEIQLRYSEEIKPDDIVSTP